MPDLLDVQNLSTEYRIGSSIIHAVNQASFLIRKGTITGILGESGSGKTTLIKSILGILPSASSKITNGKVIFHEKDLISLDPAESQYIIKRKIGYAPQDLISAYNPNITIEEHFSNLISESIGISRPDARDWIFDCFRMVGIPGDTYILGALPAQVSSGDLQKALIAKAMVREPDLMIFDQVISSMDTVTQVMIVENLRKSIEKSDRSIIWISNDIGLTMGIADHIMIMYAGRVVEYADVSAIYSFPLHPYTLAYLGSQPKLNKSSNQKLNTITGTPLTKSLIMTGCPFSNRCRFALERCKIDTPPLQDIDGSHLVACWVDTYSGKMRS